MKKFNHPSPLGYSQYTTIDLGTSTMIITAGQVAIDANGATIAPHDVGKQAEIIFDNISKIATEAGGTMSDVVKLTYYITDIKQLPAMRAARDNYINRDHPPASTAVEVSKLFRDDVVLEIEAMMVIGKR